MPFTIGILDSGSEVDILAGSATGLLGLTGQYLTENSLPIGGIGDDTIDTIISEPLGLYVTGLNNIQPGNHIDPNDFVGHSNNVMLAAPAIICQEQEIVTGLVGRSLLGFYTTVIRNDQRQTVTVEGKEYSSPSIEFLPRNSTNIPPFTRRIPITVANSSSGEPTIATTASFYRLYFPEMGLDFLTPTTLSPYAGSMIAGATFAVEVEITQDGRTKTLNFILDTGAQTTIINTNTVDLLGLPLNGDFFVEVCGVSGSVNDVPGYYLDQLDIYGSGGPLSFSHVPVIATDFGTSYDGILGMNVFYDRNITLAPDISLLGSSCKLYVSDPVDFADADFNNDQIVNLIDFADFAKSWLSSYGDQNYNIKHDLFLSDSIDMTDLEIFTKNWLKEN